MHSIKIKVNLTFSTSSTLKLDVCVDIAWDRYLDAYDTYSSFWQSIVCSPWFESQHVTRGIHFSCVASDDGTPLSEVCVCRSWVSSSSPDIHHPSDVIYWCAGKESRFWSEISFTIFHCLQDCFGTTWDTFPDKLVKQPQTFRLSPALRSSENWMNLCTSSIMGRIHFRPKTISSTDTFIKNTISSNDIFNQWTIIQWTIIQWHFQARTVCGNINTVRVCPPFGFQQAFMWSV